MPGRETTHPFHGGHRRHNQDASKGGDDDEAKPGINCPLDYGVKIFAEGRHVEVAVCVGENGDVFVGHGFILPVTIALGGGSKSR